ncbi:MAG: hypothetical protein EPO01_12235 [Aquabacterium sp.]|nr:MAG: hypothetical protein EPO01_12235 [Aquabacterium sp.]
MNLILSRCSLAAALVAALLAGCAQPQPPKVVGVIDLSERPAERALMTGMRAYEDGQYAESEKQLTTALQASLASPRDRAAAHKYLAFIYCTTKREAQCEAAFKAARAADAGFALNKSEAGHPMWGPVYKRAIPQQ